MQHSLPETLSLADIDIQCQNALEHDSFSILPMLEPLLGLEKYILSCFSGKSY